MNKIISHKKLKQNEYYKDLILFLYKINVKDFVVFVDEDNRHRFERNKLVCYLKNNYKFKIDEIWNLCDNEMISLKEIVKFYIDIGYSLDGFLELFEEIIKKTLLGKQKVENDKIL